MRVWLTNVPSQDIFSLFIKVILPALWDPTHAYNTQHKYVLTSLSEVKSILLINEVTNPEDLLLYLFSSVFDGISGSSKSTTGEQVAKDVEYHMTDILSTLIEESSSLPPDVTDVIMAQFLRAAPPGGHRDKAGLDGTQTTLLPKEEPPAYVMAKTLCNGVHEKMSRFVGQYFTDVIVEASGKGGQINGHRDDDESDDDAHGESNLKELRKAHLLLRELWRASPKVLQSVILQVDHELSADDVQVRLLATETIGDMISGIGAAGPPPPAALDPAAYPPLKLSDEIPEHPASSILTTPIAPLSFAQTHPQVFHNFTTRKIDKSPLIRAAWTTAAGYIVSTSAGNIGLSREDETLFINGLRDKLNDNDEKVRLAAVKAIEAFSFRDIITKLSPLGGVDKEGSIIFTLADRCRDKRPSIRVEAMALLAKLWAVASGEVAAGHEAVTAAVSGIPSKIYNTFYANEQEMNVLLERVIYECLLPLAFPPPKTKNTKASNGNSQSQSTAESTFDQDRIRAERILLLVKGLDEKAMVAFNALQARQPQFQKIVETFVQQCEAYNGGNPGGNAEAVKKNLRKTINYICGFLPDPVKVEADLHGFANWHDRRSYQLVKFAVSAESDFKTMHRAIKELVKRVKDSPKPHMLDTLVPLLYRSAYIMFNTSHLSTFLAYSKSNKDGFATIAQEITTNISQYNPDLFKTHVGELCKDIMEAAPSASKENDSSIVETLKACSTYSRKYPEELPVDRKFNQALISYALYGQPAKVAKYAVNILMAKKDDKSTVSATDLLQKIMKDWRYNSPHFPCRLAAVSQLELLASKVTADSNDAILNMAIKNVLMEVRTDARDSDPDWVDDAALDEEGQVKRWALKSVVNRLRGIEDPEEAKTVAPPVFKLLRSLLKEGGELCKVKDTPKHHKARLRLLAGQSYLKLCTFKQFEELLPHRDFNQVAFLALDQSQTVRRLFVEKLQKYLVQGRLRPRFYTMIFLTAWEPTTSFKQQIETWIRSRAKYFQDTKQTTMESTIARLIALLARHPDYSSEPDDLVDHARYILFYISTVATEENFSLIFKFAERVKQAQDGLDPSQSENLYVLSDLTQSLLRKWQERKNWSFQADARKVGLPHGLYAKLPNHDVAQQIAEKQYLPDGVDERLDELLRSLDKKKVRSQTPQPQPLLVLRIDIIGAQKRKNADERAEGHPAQKKAKVAQLKSAAKPKTVAVKATKSTKKTTTKSSKSREKSRKAATSSSPAVDSADRRRSGRTRKSSTYIERDDSEDDDDMLEGVAEWEYYDDSGNKMRADEPEDDDSTLSEAEKEEGEPETESEVEAEAVDEGGKEIVALDEAPDSDLSEPPVEDADEDEREEEEEEVPKATNGRRSRAATTAAAAASKPKSIPSRPAVKASASKPKSPAASKTKAKPTPKAKPTNTRSTRSRRAAAVDDDVNGDSE